MKMLACLLVSLMPGVALAQTAEDAHVQHEGKLADTALNAEYRSTMARMAAADRSRDDDLKKGAATPDSRPTYAAALLAAERAWLVYRDAHCVTVGPGPIAVAPRRTRRKASASTTLTASAPSN